MSQRAPRPRTVSKARSVSAAPVKGMPAASAAPSTPEQQMARPVRVQITRVSKKTPVMLISPCRSGSSVSAQAAAMAAEPSPASLEKTPRAMPWRMTARRVTVPNAPPNAAEGASAQRSISAAAPGSRGRLPIITAPAPPMYSSAITGTSTEETSAMRRMPPSRITSASAAVASPVSARGRENAAKNVSASAPD